MLLEMIEDFGGRLRRRAVSIVEPGWFVQGELLWLRACFDCRHLVDDGLYRFLDPFALGRCKWREIVS